jgi:hypothetical protein
MQTGDRQSGGLAVLAVHGTPGRERADRRANSLSRERHPVINNAAQFARGKQRRAGVVLASIAFGLALHAASEAIAQTRPTQARIEGALQNSAAQIKLTLPRALNESTTAVDVRAEGMSVVYVIDIKSGYEIADMKPIEVAMTQKLCATEMRQSIADGVSITYEYWTTGANRKLRGKFNIAACP